VNLKLPLFLAITRLPVAGKAELAGDWTGVLNFSSRTLHTVLHISGPDNALTATHDSPDQNIYGHTVSSIALSGTTLQFAFKELNVTYSGDLNSNGSIIGTFTQSDISVPLVLTRTVAPQPHPALNGPPGELHDGVYHNNVSGVELTLPAGWSAVPTPVQGDLRYEINLLDPEHRANSFNVDMRHYENLPDRLPASLNLALETLVERRDGKNGARGVPGYKIREGSVEHTMIGGLPALRAVGEFERNGMKITELLAWIFTVHTRTEFTARAPAEKVGDLQPVFEQILQSARIP
jgi:hypothetical protein